MNCERCGATITDQTHERYRHRCVPCFRLLPHQRWRAFKQELKNWAITYWEILLALFRIPVKRWRIARLERAPKPFTRHQVVSQLGPVLSGCDVEAYYSGMRDGYLSQSEKVHPSHGSASYHLGWKDGRRVYRDPSQLAMILEARKCDYTKWRRALKA